MWQVKGPCRCHFDAVEFGEVRAVGCTRGAFNASIRVSTALEEQLMRRGVDASMGSIDGSRGANGDEMSMVALVELMVRRWVVSTAREELLLLFV